MNKSHMYMVLNVITYLAVISLMIAAIMEPYMEFPIAVKSLVANIKHYVNKTCVNNECFENDDSMSGLPKEIIDSNKALYALYIIFIILTALCFVLYLTKQHKYCNIVGLLVILVAFAVMITVIAIVKTTPVIIPGFHNKNYEFGNGGIMAIVAACLIIVKIAFVNTYIRKLF